MRKKILLLICLGLSLCLNIAAIYTLYSQRDKVQLVLGIANEEQKYPLLSKRILQEFPQDVLINFLQLRKELQAQIAPFEDSIAVYFEYLPTGTSIGINSQQEFHAESHAELPLVMAYEHMRERLQLPEDAKASELVTRAVVYGDTAAVNALSSLIQQYDYGEISEAVDMDFIPKPRSARISARSYASVLKALYFSSVLSKEESQALLDLLTQTKSADKLAAGVPLDVNVAHTTGTLVGEDGKVGYRDCGIVYVPRRPYVLCMFSASDEASTKVRMQAISAMVYTYVSTKDLLIPPAQLE